MLSLDFLNRCQIRGCLHPPWGGVCTPYGGCRKKIFFATRTYPPYLYLTPPTFQILEISLVDSELSKNVLDVCKDCIQWLYQDSVAYPDISAFHLHSASDNFLSAIQPRVRVVLLMASSIAQCRLVECRFTHTEPVTLTSNCRDDGHRSLRPAGPYTF